MLAQKLKFKGKRGKCLIIAQTRTGFLLAVPGTGKHATVLRDQKTGKMESAHITKEGSKKQYPARFVGFDEESEQLQPSNFLIPFTGKKVLVITSNLFKKCLKDATFIQSKNVIVDLDKFASALFANRRIIDRRVLPKYSKSLLFSLKGEQITMVAGKPYKINLAMAVRKFKKLKVSALMQQLFSKRTDLSSSRN